MSGSLSDLFGYAGDNPVGAAPQQQSTLADVLARLKALYGSAQNGVGAAQNAFSGFMAPTPPQPPQAPPVAAAPAPAPVPAAPPVAPPPQPAVAAPTPPQQTTVQQASLPSLGGASSSSSPADYSAASPPPDASRALVVQEAAKKYGVPLEVANWVGFHESGWNPNVGTNDYGATGPWQFKKATADQYGLKDPNDFNSSTDAAMRLLADNFKKTGNWADAIGNYGTFSTGRGNDADVAARQGFLKYAQNLPNVGGMGPSAQFAGPGAPSNDYTPQQKQQLNALGIDPSQFKLPFDYQQAVQPSLSEKLYRMAAALTGNPGAAANAMAQDRQKMFEANNNELSTQRLLGQLGYNIARINQGDRKLDQGDTGLGIKQQQATTAATRADIARAALEGRLNPNIAAQLAQAKKGGTDAAMDINNTMSTQAIQADNQGLADIDNAQKLIQQKPELMGPTLASRWSRFAAENGLTGDAADLNALQKMTTDQRNQMLASLTNGHVGGIRSNAELQNISKAVADVGTSPAAAQFILNLQKSQIQARQAWRQELQDRYQNDPESITGQHLAFTRQHFLNEYNKANPLPEYNSPTAQNSAGASPGKNADGSTKGASQPPIGSFWSK